MKLRALCLALAIPFATAVQTAHAESSQPIQQMAQILLTMDKAPNKQQSETLKNLASSAPSANEQRLAKGLLSFNGALTEEGKQEVWAVMRQITAADSERELAKIINRFAGSASAAEKERLTALLPAQSTAEQKSAKTNNKKSDKVAKKADKK